MPDSNQHPSEINEKNQLLDFLHQQTIMVAEGLTRILSDPDAANLGARNIVHAFLKAKLFRQLGNELRHLQESDQVKEDYFSTPPQQSTLHELLVIIDENPPDDGVFKALKSIFFCAVANDATEADERRAYHYLRLCKRLDSVDILLLEASWTLYMEDPAYLEKEHDSKGMSLAAWAEIVSKRVPLPPELLQLHSRKLEALNLFSGLDDHHVSLQNNRLTRLGVEICRHITKYGDVRLGNTRQR